MSQNSEAQSSDEMHPRSTPFHSGLRRTLDRDDFYAGENFPSFRPGYHEVSTREVVPTGWRQRFRPLDEGRRNVEPETSRPFEDSRPVEDPRSFNGSWVGDFPRNPPTFWKPSRRRKPHAPIQSHGIVCCSRNTKGEIVILALQRRDTYEFIDFVRGSWTEKSLLYLISMMSDEERMRIVSYEYDDLLRDLRMGKESYFKDCEEKAKSKFEKVKILLPDLVGNAKVLCREPSWGFPKGKKNAKEESLECALREFEEETTIPASFIQIIQPHPFIEVFRGSDNRDYSTYYYPAICPYPKEVAKTKLVGCIRKECVTEEAHDVRWMTLFELKEKLDQTRFGIAKRVYEMVDQLDPDAFPPTKKSFASSIKERRETENLV